MNGCLWHIEAPCSKLLGILYPQDSTIYSARSRIHLSFNAAGVHEIFSFFYRGFRIGETIYILLWDKTVNFAMRMCDFRCRGLQATEKCNRGLKKKKPVIVR